MSWQVWIAKNKYIFQDLCTYPKHIIVKILEMLKAHPVPILQNSSRRLIAPAPSFDFPTSFFDGASSNGIGGIGVHIRISKEH